MAPTLSLSTTGFSDAASCLKKYQYHFVDRIVSRPENISKPMRKGIWLHRCLQDHHTGKDWQKSLARLMGQALAWGLDGDAMQEIYDECRLLMASYVKFYPNEMWEILADEKEYRATFGNVELRATVDALAKIPGKGLYLVEYKSTSDIPPAAWRAVDPQTALQAIILLANGIQVDGILFDYLDTSPKVPRITLKHEFHGATGVTTSAHFTEAVTKLLAAASVGSDELPSRYNDYINEKRAELVDDGRFFQRFYVQRQPELLHETMRDVAGIADRVIRAQAAGVWPRSFNVMSCRRFCSYSEVCNVEYVKGSPSEVIRQEHYVRDDGYREGNVT